MQQEYASETLLKPATLYFEFDGEDTATAVTDQSGAEPKGVSRAARHLAYANSNDAMVTPETESSRQTVWSKVLNFILEGFSIGGVSLSPVDDFLDDDRWSGANHRPHEMISSNGQRVIGMLPTPSPEPRWNWRASSQEVTAALSEHLRKERDIRRAVDALSQLDDETLQDIGIPHRSRIEYVVRYCHDC